MRLNAYLARAGVASRRGAEDLIRAGRVRVNGEVAGLATFVEPRDTVEVDGRPIEPEPLTYVLLHKPAGVVTTARDPQGRATVVGLVWQPKDRLVPCESGAFSAEAYRYRTEPQQEHENVAPAHDHSRDEPRPSF